jgi:hypothetical protein
MVVSATASSRSASSGRRAWSPAAGGGSHSRCGASTSASAPSARARWERPANARPPTTTGSPTACAAVTQAAAPRRLTGTVHDTANTSMSRTSSRAAGSVGPGGVAGPAAARGGRAVLAQRSGVYGLRRGVAAGFVGAGPPAAGGLAPRHPPGRGGHPRPGDRIGGRAGSARSRAGRLAPRRCTRSTTNLHRTRRSGASPPCRAGRLRLPHVLDSAQGTGTPIRARAAIASASPLLELARGGIGLRAEWQPQPGGPRRPAPLVAAR